MHDKKMKFISDLEKLLNPALAESASNSAPVVSIASKAVTPALVFMDFDVYPPQKKKIKLVDGRQIVCNYDSDSDSM